MRGRFPPNGSSPAASHRPSNHFPALKKKKKQHNEAMNLGHGGPRRLRGASPGENLTRKENGDNSEEITSGVFVASENKTARLTTPRTTANSSPAFLRRVPPSNSERKLPQLCRHATRGDSEWKCHGSQPHPLLLFLICSNSRPQCGVRVGRRVG